MEGRTWRTSTAASILAIASAAPGLAETRSKRAHQSLNAVSSETLGAL